RFHRRRRSVRGADRSGARPRHRGTLARGERAARGCETRGARTCAGAGAGERVTAVTAGTDHLIKPHGGTLVDRAGDPPDGVESPEQVALAPRELSALDMIAGGALSPLEGFMGGEDYERVVEEMRLASGLPWALPVCLAVDEAPKGDQVALTDEAGKPLAVLD